MQAWLVALTLKLKLAVANYADGELWLGLTPSMVIEGLVRSQKSKAQRVA